MARYSLFIALLLALLFPVLATELGPASAGKGPKVHTHVCDYAGHGTEADRPRNAKPPGTPGNGGGGGGGGGGDGKKISCGKTFAKWTATQLEVYVDDTGAPGTVGAGALADYAAKAFDEFACHAGIPTINFTNNENDADIVIEWGDLGPNGTLGQALTSYISGVIVSSTITMNSNQGGFTWTEGDPPAVDVDGCIIAESNGNTSTNIYDLFSVLLHEIGHALGLDHPNGRCRSRDKCYPMTMYSCTASEEYMRRDLEQGDADAAVSNYGSP